MNGIPEIVYINMQCYIFLLTNTQIHLEYAGLHKKILFKFYFSRIMLYTAPASSDIWKCGIPIDCDRT